MHARSRWLFVVAACVSLAGPVAALDRIEYVSATKVYFTGSTSLDNLIEGTFIAAAGGICDPVLSDIDIWRTSTQSVITCRASNENAPGHGFAVRSSGGTMIAFHKDGTSSTGNGSNALIAVARGQAHAVRWLDVGALPDDCLLTLVAATATMQAYRLHSSCASVMTPIDTASTTTYDAHGAVTDIEPLLGFPSPGADAQRLAMFPALDVVLGVPATTNLYRALQKAQFGSGSTCDGADTSNCVPSLTRAQLRALYSQTVYDWSQFRVNGIALPAAPGVLTPTDEFVRICRRVAPSDTQAAFESYFLKERCVAGVPGFALPDDASTIHDVVYSPSDFSNSLVNAGPSSANVRTCLSVANTQGFWALGVMTTESADAGYANGSAGFRLIAIDGAAPNTTNVANGDYDFFVEASFQRISNTYPGNVGSLVDGNPRREVIELLVERLRTPSRLVGSCATARPWGQGCLLASGGISTPNTAPYSDAEMAASPVNTMTRNGNSCGPALAAKETTVNGTPNP